MVSEAATFYQTLNIYAKLESNIGSLHSTRDNYAVTVTGTIGDRTFTLYSNTFDSREQAQESYDRLLKDLKAD